MYFDYEKTINLNKKSGASSSKALAHTGPIIGLAYTNNGHRIISLGKDNSLRLWDSISGLNTLVNYGKAPLNSAVAEACLQISTIDMCNPNYVFIPGGNNLLMYSILDGELVQTFKGHYEAINCCLYNSALNEVYTGSKDRNVLIWSNEKDPNELVSEKIDDFQSNPYSVLSSTGRNSAKRPRADNWSDDE
jgi:DNA excision repair protein ERCC-8